MSPCTTTTTPSPDTIGRGAWPPQLRTLLGAPAPDTRLLDAATAGPDDRVLILGAPTAELLCEALRHGCRSALEIAMPPPRPEPADVVVAPALRSAEAAMAVVACARRALGGNPRGGRLALSLAGTGARALAAAIRRQLRAAGFQGIRLAGAGDGLLLVGRLPGAAG